MADDCVRFLFVFFQEIFCTGEGHLVDIPFDFLGGHADSVVADGDSLGFSINGDVDTTFFRFRAVACHCRHATFADGIRSVADQFPQKDLMP